MEFYNQKKVHSSTAYRLSCICVRAGVGAHAFVFHSLCSSHTVSLTHLHKKTVFMYRKQPEGCFFNTKRSKA